MGTILKVTLLTCSLIFFSHASFAQDWIISVSVDMQGSDCFQENLTSVSWSYNDTNESDGFNNDASGSGTISTTQAYLATFTFSGSGVYGQGPGGTLSISASGTCGFWVPPLSGGLSGSKTITIGAPDYPEYSSSCASKNYPVTPVPAPGGSGISVTVTYYSRLRVNTPTVANCKDVTFSNSYCVSSINWEVSDTGVNNWKPLGATSTHTLTSIRSLFTRKYGVFYVRGKDGTTRTSPSESFTIDAPPPTASFIDTDVNCFGGDDGTISLTISPSIPEITSFYIKGFHQSNISISNANSDAWTPDLQILNSGINPTITKANIINGLTGIIPGDWKFIIVNNTTTSTYGACGTLFEGLVSIGQPAQVTVSLTPTHVTCNGLSNGTLVATALGGAGGYTYKWPHNATNTTNQATGLGPGSYKVQVKDSKNCPTPTATAYAEDTKTITEPSALSVIMARLSDFGGYGVRCHYESNGAARATASGGNGGYTYVWSSGETINEIVSKTPNTYTVTVNDSKNCQASNNVLLNAPPPINFAIDQITQLVCPGDKTDLAVISLVNNINTTSYLWLGTGETSSEVYQKLAGTHTVRVSDQQGCYTTKSIVIEDPKPLTVAVTTLSDYNGAPIECPKDDNGKLGTIVLDHSTDPPSIVTPENYSWLKNSVNYLSGSTLSSIDNLEEANYEVRVQYRTQCEARSSVVFLNDPEPVDPTIHITSNYTNLPLSCAGASDAGMQVVTTGGTNGPVYPFILWSTGETVQTSVSGKPAGEYHVLVKDVNGCEGRDTILIEDPESIVASITGFSQYASFGVTCLGASDGSITVTATGGTDNFSYQWSNGDITPTVNSLPAGYYVVRITDENGCDTETSHTITTPDAVQLAIAEIKNVSCHGGENGAIELKAFGGAGDYRFAINTPSSWQQGELFENLEATDYQFYVEDVNGCQQNVFAALSEPEPLAITFQNIEPAFCGDARGKVTGVVTGGVSDYIFEWRNSQSNVIGTAPTLSNLKAGVYQLFVNDAHDCPVDNAVPITSTDGAKTKHTAITTKCFNSADGSAAIEITEGEGPFVFEWPNGINTYDANGLEGGTYHVVVTDARNCDVIESVFIPSPPAIALAVKAEQIPTCYGSCDGEISLEATGGTGSLVYSWNGSSAVTQAQLCAGSYLVKITDTNNCILEKNIHLVQPDAISVEATHSQLPTCKDGCDGMLEANASGGNGDYSYQWTNGPASNTINNICPGQHTILVRDIKGCTGNAVLTLNNTLPVAVGLADGATVCVGQTFQLDAGPGWTSQTWKSNGTTLAQERSIEIKDPGLYILDVVTNEGCAGKDTFLLETSLSLLEASFLMAEEAFTSDTVVFIDISWPLPEQIEWTFPSQMKKLVDGGYLVYGQFDESGTYDVFLTANLGKCRDQVGKTITILQGDDNNEGGRLGFTKFLKAFTLHPNPNDGIFDVDVAFSEASDITMSIWSMPRGLLISKAHDSGAEVYNKAFNLKPLSPGIYVLRLDHKEGTDYIRFVVH